MSDTSGIAISSMVVITPAVIINEPNFANNVPDIDTNTKSTINNENTIGKAIITPNIPKIILKIAAIVLFLLDE